MLFKIKKFLINFSKKNIVVRKLLRGTLYIKNYLIYKITTLFIKTDEKTIIFEECSSSQTVLKLLAILFE